MSEAPVRAAKAADLPGMLTLYRELRPADPQLAPPDAQRNWEAVLRHPGLHVFVAEIEGGLACTCMLAIIPNVASGGRPFGVIEHVVTLPAFRSRGLGQSVLRHALDFAWAHGCYKAMLLSGAERTQAHRLYEAVGFRGDVERGFVAKPP
jgi:GNAT superfamily N-acetyltransferase